MIITDSNFIMDIESKLKEKYNREIKVLEVSTIKKHFNGGSRNVIVAFYDVDNDVLVKRYLRPLLFEKRARNFSDRNFSQTKEDKKVEKRFKKVIKDIKKNNQKYSTDILNSSLEELISNQESTQKREEKSNIKMTQKNDTDIITNKDILEKLDLILAELSWRTDLILNTQSEMKREMSDVKSRTKAIEDKVFSIFK